MSSTGSSSPRRGNTGGKEDRPRFFGTTAKAKCWSNAQVVPGRHPERWRKDAAGNIVCKRFCNCQGCLCFEYDHILPFSKGTHNRPTLEGADLEKANKILALSATGRHYKNIITTENLTRCDFIPKECRLSPNKRTIRTKRRREPTDMPPPKGSFIQWSDTSATLPAEHLPDSENNPPARSSVADYPPARDNSKIKLDVTSKRKAHIVGADDDATIPHPSKKHKSIEDMQGEGSIPRSSLDSLGVIAAQHVTEEELKKWFQLSPEEASDTITKATLQATILQLTRAKEIREAACSAKKAKDEAKSLRSQLTKQKNDHEKKVNELKEKLHSERVTYKEEISDLESQISILKQENQTLLTSHESEVAKLNEEIATFKMQSKSNPEGCKALYDKGYNAGIDDYMKSFVRQMPNFDWAPFGEVNVKWAEDVKALITKEDAEEEAKKKKEAQSQKGTTLKHKDGDKVTQTKEGCTRK